MSGLQRIEERGMQPGTEKGMQTVIRRLITQGLI